MDKKEISIYAPSEFSGLNIAMACAHLGIGSSKVFAEPPPIDIDELLPDEIFDWHKIGIGCDCPACQRKKLWIKMKKKFAGLPRLARGALLSLLRSEATDWQKACSPGLILKKFFRTRHRSILISSFPKNLCGLP